MVADEVLFNSKFNMDSFILTIDTFLKHGVVPPDQRPNTGVLKNIILNKSNVLYFPVKMDPSLQCHFISDIDNNSPLHILWNHRWEYDKRPDLFFNVLYNLQETNVKFKVSIIGESFGEIPTEFNEAKQKLEQYILHWGFVESKEKYFQILYEADVVVSTTDHEFLG
jgi:glycosyltransferase involved in cell wall biosynthesis